MLAATEYWALAFSALVVIPAFALRGTTGFGGSLVAVPLMALVLPVHVVLPVITSLNLASALQQAWGGWRLVVWREILRLTPFMIAGIVVGLYFFHHLQGSSLKVALGLFLIGYAVVTLLRQFTEASTTPRTLPWPIAAMLSAVGGVAGSLFGASTPFYAIYFNALNAARDTFRMTLTVLLLLQHSVRITGYASMGVIDTYSLLLFAVVLPFSVVGTRLGGLIAGKLDAQQFTRIVALLVLFCGCGLVVSA
jgi:uncharacterized protein